MTYPKQLPEDRLTALAPLLEQLEALREGESRQVQERPEALDRIRLDLYAHWHATNRKGEFRIRRVAPDTMLVVRLHRARPQVSSLASKGQLFARDCLLDAENTSECLAIINQAKKEGRLSPADAFSAYEEWARVMGEDQ